MSLFASFMVLLLILVEVAPPTAASIPNLGESVKFSFVTFPLSLHERVAFLYAFTVVGSL